MDPDECLAQLRSQSADIQRQIDRGEFDYDTEKTVSRLLDLIDSLDGWLTKGGFLPNQWQQHR